MNNENKDLNNELDSFLDIKKQVTPKVNNTDEVVITSRTGLIERVDKILVVSDGRQLLKEQLFEGNVL